MHRSSPFTKKITGTAAAITVNCGFKPKYVRLINETQLATAEHVDGMAAARMALTDDSGAGTTDITVVTSAAITLTPTGFIIGTNATINSASDVIYVVAW